MTPRAGLLLLLGAAACVRPVTAGGGDLPPGPGPLVWVLPPVAAGFEEEAAFRAGSGELFPHSRAAPPARGSRARLVDPQGSTGLLRWVAGEREVELRFLPEWPGAHLATLETPEEEILWPSGAAFRASLEARGEAGLAALLEAEPTPGPVRELRRWEARGLAAVGGSGRGRAARWRSRHSLEILPLASPLEPPEDGRLPVLLIRDEEPWAGARLHWLRWGTERAEGSLVTDASGRAAVPVGEGLWLLWALETRPPGEEGGPWRSRGGSYSFCLPEPPAGP